MFIKSIAPLLSGSDRVKVEIAAAKDGKLTVLITTVLAKIDPDTTDPVIAARQAALARPIFLTVDGNADPDAELHAALASIQPVRQDIAANHAAYLDDLAKAEADAKAAAAAAKSKPKRVTGTKVPTASVSVAGDEEEESDAADDKPSSGDETTNPVAPVPAGPAPESAAGLFD